MKIKINDATKELCKSTYEKGCNQYLCALADAWDLDCRSYGYWVAGEVGGLYAYGDDLYINMGDIVYCVDNDIPQSEYMEYQEYNGKALEFGFNTMNLMSWHNGAPRVEQAVFDRLYALKGEISDLCDETIRKQNGESNG